MAEQEDAEKKGSGEESAANQPATKAGLPLGNILVVAVGVLVLLGTPAMTYMVVKQAAKANSSAAGKSSEGGSSGESGGHGGGKSEGGEGTVLALKSILVNVAETKGTRMLKIEPHLVVSDNATMKKLNTSFMPMLVDRIILAAGRKTIDELEGAQGREALKRDIISEVNGALKGKVEGSVVNVYFNEFLVQ